MPLLWLLNAREGSGYPLRVVNYLNNYAHRRDVYAAIVVPDEDGQPALAWTLGPIWDEVGAPIIEVNDERLRAIAREWGVNEGLGFAILIGHELGHTVLWHVDHNLGDDSQEFGGDAGNHVIGQDGRVGQHTIHCLNVALLSTRHLSKWVYSLLAVMSTEGATSVNSSYWLDGSYSNGILQFKS